MKIGELRALIKTAPPERVASALAEAYKKVPKDKKEELDSILVPMLSPNAPVPKAPAAPKKPAVDVDSLAERIEDFTDKAYDGCFYYRNNRVTKANRPKWRFTVKGFVKELDAVRPEDSGYPKVRELYLKLYRVLCRGEIEHLFHGDQPFQSIEIGKTDFLDKVLDAHDLKNSTPEELADLMDAVCRTYGSTTYLEELAWYLNEDGLRERALETAKALSGKYIRLYGEKPTSFFMITADSIEGDYAAEHAAQLVLLLAGLCSNEKCLETLDFYYEHCHQSDLEIALYIALNLVDALHSDDEEEDDRAELDNLWLAVYRDALKRNIVPRDTLKNSFVARVKAQKRSQGGSAQ